MSLPHLILGLLDEQPMSGYDLNKAFQETVRHFWTVDQSQIYRALYRLHDDALVDVEVIEQEDYPDKKVYHLTTTGSEKLVNWLRRPIDAPPPREGWLGQIFFAGRISNTDLITNLEAHRAELESTHHVLAALRAHLLERHDNDRRRMSRKGFLRLLTLDYGVDVHRFHIDWLTEAIQTITNRKED